MYTRHPDHLTLSDEGRRLLAQALKESGGDILLSRDLLRHRESDMDGVKRVLGAVAEGRAHRTALADVGAIPDGKVWKLSGAAQ